MKSLEPPHPLTARVEDVTVHGHSATPEDVVDRLRRFGACIIERLVGAPLLDEIDQELGKTGLWEDAKMTPLGQDALVKAPKVAALLEHDLVVKSAEGLLGPQSRSVQLKLIAIRAFQPGEREQLLHREDGLFPWNHQPHHWCLDVLWALDDFTPENGATMFVPYSQFWRRRAENERPELALQALMPRGSVLLFTGGTLHGGGLNVTTDQRRKGVLSGYEVGWLKSEHRFWTYKPLREKVARGELSETMQSLLGYAEPALPGTDISLKKQSEDWDREQMNLYYLARSKEQVLDDPKVTDQEVGSRWFDEAFYSSGFWRPPTPNPAKDGDYITRLRQRRPWTMSAYPEKKEKK